MLRLTRFARAYYGRYYTPKQLFEGGFWTWVAAAQWTGFVVWGVTTIDMVDRFPLTTLPPWMALATMLVIAAAMLPVGTAIVAGAHARRLRRTGRNGRKPCKTWQCAKRRTLRRWLRHTGLTPQDAIERIRLATEHARQGDAIFGAPEPALLDFVYTAAARARILTLFVLFCSTLIGLSIARGQTIDSLFSLLAFAGERGWLWYLWGLGFAALMVHAARQVFTSLQALSLWFQAVWGKRWHRSAPLLKFIERDLILLFLTERTASSAQPEREQ